MTKKQKKYLFFGALALGGLYFLRKSTEKKVAEAVVAKAVEEGAQTQAANAVSGYFNLR